MNYCDPIISVVIPVYNVEDYINRCLDSFLAQTFKEYELILVNDGSTDHSADICQAYKSRFSQIAIPCTIIHQENGGLSAARNTGIFRALYKSTSKWITFTDSDDWVHPQYLELLYSAALNKAADVVIGRYDRCGSLEEAYDGLIQETYEAEVPDLEEYWINHRTNATVAWGKLYLKSLLEGIRYPVGKYHEDEYVTYKILFSGIKAAYVDIPIYHYYQNQSGIMHKNYMKRMPDLLEVFRDHILFFRQSAWPEVYRLEVEKYAEAISEGIWFLTHDYIYDKRKKRTALKKLRSRLRKFLRTHRSDISWIKRKDIFIAAYPFQTVFIRGYGWIRSKF